MYAAFRLGSLESRFREMESTLMTVEVGATIDYGDNVGRTTTVHLAKGSTVLDAFKKIATVETRYYTGLGEYVVSIDGVSEDMSANKYWQWYILQENTASWGLGPVGAGSYELSGGENIKFSYEVVPW